MLKRSNDKLSFPGNPDALFEKDENGELVGFLSLPVSLLRRGSVEDYINESSIIFLRAQKPIVKFFRNKSLRFTGRLFRVTFKAPVSCEINDIQLFSSFFHRWEEDIEPTYSINGFGEYGDCVSGIDLFLFNPKHDVFKTHAGAVLTDAVRFVTSISEIKF